jgi:anti-sigma regulatory factor (Ser/Thr protein kinase)
MDCLIEQPAAVVIDASHLDLTDDLGLTVLAGVARESLRWPGTRFALVGPAVVRDAAQRLGIDQFVSVCPDLAAASILFQSAAPPTRHDRMMPDPNAPGLARLAVHEFCQQYGVGGDGDAAQLVASELVTNAVVHAHTEIDLTLRLVGGLLHIAVRDTGPGEARMTDIVDESSPNGRGLRLVDALASAWGSLVPNTGKVVWATVRVRPAPQNRL